MPLVGDRAEQVARSSRANRGDANEQRDDSPGRSRHRAKVTSESPRRIGERALRPLARFVEPQQRQRTGAEGHADQRTADRAAKTADQLDGNASADTESQISPGLEPSGRSPL